DTVREHGQPSDPGLPRPLTTLGSVYLAQGKFDRAEPLLREALEFDRVTQGEEQPGHTATLHNLAGLCAATGREAEALTLFEKIGAIEARLLPLVVTMVSESGRALYLQTVQENAEK